jgi:hypothetical protein
MAQIPSPWLLTAVNISVSVGFLVDFVSLGYVFPELCGILLAVINLSVLRVQPSVIQSVENRPVRGRI